MPIYEYECETCGNKFEIIQRFSDSPLTECPSCGGAVRKLLSAPAIQFKGSGWYITDYGRKGNGASSNGKGDKGAADPPAPAAKETEGGSQPKAAAPAAKSDSKPS
jgi:putative FmdB family regulatory protein